MQPESLKKKFKSKFFLNRSASNFELNEFHINWIQILFIAVDIAGHMHSVYIRNNTFHVARWWEKILSKRKQTWSKTR